MTKDLLHQLLDNAKDLYFVLDGSTHVIYANEAAKEVYNFETNSAESFLDYVHPDDKDSVQQMFSLLLDSPSSSHPATFRIKHRKEDWRIFESQCWADGANDSGIRLLISAHDATSRVQAQLELRKKKNQLDRAQRVVNLGTWELNLTTSELSGSDHFYKLYGLSPRDSMSFLTLQEQFHPDDLDKINGVFQRAQETMGAFDLDYRIIRKDNIERVLHIRGQVDFIGNEFLMYGIARDVTEIRSIKKALKRTERRFEAIFDATFEFIGLLNMEGTLVEINETALRFGGLEEEEVIGKPFWECAWWKISTIAQDKLKNEILNAANGEFIRYNTEIYGACHEVVTMDFSTM